MSVRERIEDAKSLWQAGRKEGAFIQILVAAAATARKRYPKPPKGTRIDSKRRPYAGEATTDSIAFKTFVLDEMGTVTGGPKYNVAFPFRGRGNVPLEEILYEHLRCSLIHEAETPRTIEFTEAVIENGKSHASLRLTDPLGLPEFWLWNLARAVARAPENADLFRDYSINNQRNGT
jgi:hypothetical protein